MSTDGGRGPAQGRYRTQRPGQRDNTLGAMTPPVTPDGSLPSEWNESTPAALPAGTKWTRVLHQVDIAARLSDHYRGSIYMGGARPPLVPGSLILLCTRHDQLQVYIYMPENIWHRTNQPDVEHRDGWARLLRTHCRGWVTLSRAQRILRACNEAAMELERGLALTDSLADRRAFTAAQATYARIAAQVTGEVSELTHHGLITSLDAWIADVAAHAQADRDVVLTMLTEALEAENAVDDLAADENARITRDDSYQLRIAVVIRIMTRLNIVVGDVQRFIDLANSNPRWSTERVAQEAETRHRVDSAFGQNVNITGTQSGRASSARSNTTSVSRRRRDPDGLPRPTPTPTPTTEPVRSGALTRLAQNIRIRQRRDRNAD